jgi:hypothetical protein
MALPQTKRALVTQLLKGPIAIERAAVVHWYRASIPNDADPSRGIYIALSPDHAHEHYDSHHAYAHLDGKHVRLTPREADAIAARLRRTFHLGHGPRAALDLEQSLR